MDDSRGGDSGLTEQSNAQSFDYESVPESLLVSRESTPRGTGTLKHHRSAASVSSRDVTPAPTKALSVSGHIKNSDHRVRKSGSVTTASDRGTPAPSTGKPGRPSTASMGNKRNRRKSVKNPRKKTGLNRFTDAAVEKDDRVQTLKQPYRPGKDSAKDITDDDEEDDDEEGDSDDGGEYCLCRGPDDHRMMVFCEGGCNDWYHCSCVGIDVIDAREILDRFICPHCKSETQKTTFKRICRLFCFGPHLCRKAAIWPVDLGLDNEQQSYCSEEHMLEWLRLWRDRVWLPGMEPLEKLQVGYLSDDDIANLLQYCGTLADLQAMGTRPQLSRADIEAAHPGNDYLSFYEKVAMADIEDKRKMLNESLRQLGDCEKVLKMVISKTKSAPEVLGNDLKGICGFDDRLEMNSAEFALWFESADGQRALETGMIGPKTVQIIHVSPSSRPAAANTLPNGEPVPAWFSSTCLKPRKKCQHVGWENLHLQAFLSRRQEIKGELEECRRREQVILDEAEIREATREFNEMNVTEHLDLT